MNDFKLGLITLCYFRCDFTVFANTNEIHDVFDESVLKKYKDWFENNIEADNDSVFITICVSYEPEESFQITDSNLRYNQTDCIENIKPNALSECYIDLEQKSAAYIIDNTIVSIAFDNKNGSITVLTLPEYRNMGYATKCLKKLIQVYPGNELGYATSTENKAAMRVAEKSGMKKTGMGYWIRLKSKHESKLFTDNTQVPVIEKP